MIRLLRHLGRFDAGTETDFFDAAAEAAFCLDGTAEYVDAAAAEPEGISAPEAGIAEEPEGATGAALCYKHMKKDDLLREATARGLDVSPRSKVAEIVRALEESDDADA